MHQRPSFLTSFLVWISPRRWKHQCSFQSRPRNTLLWASIQKYKIYKKNIKKCYEAPNTQIPWDCSFTYNYTVPKIIWISAQKPITSRLEEQCNALILVSEPGTRFTVWTVCSVASAPTVTGSVFRQRFRSFLGQCKLKYTILNYSYSFLTLSSQLLKWN